MSTIAFPLQKKVSAWHIFQRKSRSETLPVFDLTSCILGTAFAILPQGHLTRPGGGNSRHTWPPPPAHASNPPGGGRRACSPHATHRQGASSAYEGPKDRCRVSRELDQTERLRRRICGGLHETDTSDHVSNGGSGIRTSGDLGSGRPRGRAGALWLGRPRGGDTIERYRYRGAQPQSCRD